MDNQGKLHKYFVIIFENAWNANLYKCVIQEQLWALFKLRNVYFVLSKLQLNCYKRTWCATGLTYNPVRHNVTRTLYLHERCLSHPILDRREFLTLYKYRSLST